MSVVASSALLLGTTGRLTFVLLWVDLQMDKASIIKDAIEYIQQLQAEERALESAGCGGAPPPDEGLLLLLAERAKKMKRARSVPSIAAAPPPVEILELRVSEVGDRVLVVSVTCAQRRDAMARVCRAIEELRLRVITASVTAVAGCLMHTVFVEVRNETPQISVVAPAERGSAQLSLNPIELLCSAASLFPWSP